MTTNHAGGSARCRVLVVQHEPSCPPGSYAPWLAEAGVDVDVLHAYQGGEVPGSLAEGGHDGLMVLGGEMGANDDDQHAWLSPTKALIARTVADGLPFFGICLGHQLAAVALGGEAGKNPAGPAHGLRELSLTPDGVADPVLGVLPAGARVLHWNDDTVTRLPAGSTLLATSPDGAPAAVRLGERAWSVQFHPEVTGVLVRGWESALRTERDRAALAELEAAEAELLPLWCSLAERFAAVVLAAS